MTFKNLILMLFLAMLAGSITACNTIEGAGKDIKSAGGAIEDAADDEDD